MTEPEELLQKTSKPSARAGFSTNSHKAAHTRHLQDVRSSKYKNLLSLPNMSPVNTVRFTSTEADKGEKAGGESRGAQRDSVE